MPALSNGNTCWGNRKAFNLHSEYISDSFTLGNLFEDNSVRHDFISSNPYYGYHRVPDPPVEESMAIDETEETQVPIGGDSGAACRKRPYSSDQSAEIVKRIRQQDPQAQQQLASGTEPVFPVRNIHFNSDFCML